MTEIRNKTAKPSSSKEMAISKCVEDLGIDDKVLEIYGPTQLAESVVWEIWVKDQDGQLATRFVEECADRKNNVFDTFQQLAVRLNLQHQEIMKKLREAEWARTRDLTVEQGKATLQAANIANKRLEHIVKLGMAIGLGTCAMFVACYLALRNETPNGTLAVWVICGLVASAGGYIFGKFIAPKTADA